VTAEEKERNLPPPDCRSPTLECEFVAGRYQTLLGRAKSLRSPGALFWTAKACEELAARAYSRLRQLPPSVERHELAAKEYEERGRRLDAVKEWREAVKLSPNDLRIQRGLASSLYQNRDYEAAIPLLQGLLKRGPHSAELNFLYGSSLLNMEQPAKSIPYFQEALKNDPDFLPARAGLGQAYLRTGNPERAIPHLEASLPLDDEDGSRHYQLIRAYQMTGQQQLAVQLSQKYQSLRESAEQERRKLEEVSQIVHP
jgi:tetratricopeptide (TPR) repeat protein